MCTVELRGIRECVECLAESLHTTGILSWPMALQPDDVPKQEEIKENMYQGQCMLVHCNFQLQQGRQQQHLGCTHIAVKKTKKLHLEI